MTVKSVRAQEMSAYIENRAPLENLSIRVELEGQIQVLKVHNVPIERLFFNIRNGRFASELRAKEKALGRKLDPHDEVDSGMIQQLLLEQDPGETEALKKDLEKHGQIDAGIITRDGAIINANRRMAVISLLYNETHDQKWAYLKVAVLPEMVGEQDLWRLEANLQFAKDFRLNYGPMNELLKLREGIDCGLNSVDISVTLLGRFTDKQVDARLRVLTLIDNYLESIGKPGDYAWIGQQRLMEKFNSLSDNVIESLKKSGFDSLGLHKITNAGFALISKTGRSHWEIRKLAQIARQPEAKNALLTPLPANPLDVSVDVLEEAFSTAEDIVEGEMERDKPDRLLQKAISAVTSIDRKNLKLKTPSTQALVDQLLEACKILKND